MHIQAVISHWGIIIRIRKRYTLLWVNVALSPKAGLGEHKLDFTLNPPQRALSLHSEQPAQPERGALTIVFPHDCTAFSHYPSQTACGPSRSGVSSSLRPHGLSAPGSSVHGILQTRMEWVAIPFSRGSSWPRDRTHTSCGSCTAGRFLLLSHQGSPNPSQSSPEQIPYRAELKLFPDLLHNYPKWIRRGEKKKRGNRKIATTWPKRDKTVNLLLCKILARLSKLSALSNANLKGLFHLW